MLRKHIWLISGVLTSALISFASVSTVKVQADAWVSKPFAFNLATEVSGASHPYTFLQGPAWLNLSFNGVLSGNPGPTDIGLTSAKVSFPQGADTVEVELAITVNKAPGLNLLWVVDTSGSMAEWQSGLGSHLAKASSTLSGAIGQDVDMDVLSHDGAKLQKMGLYPPLDLADLQSTILGMGTMGSGIEAPFETVAKYWSRKSYGFADITKPLVIVYVTDEAEQSNVPVADYLKALPKNTKHYGFFMANDLANCNQRMELKPFSYSGSRFETAIVASGGKAYSLCGSLEASIADLGAMLSGIH
jgi:hypothetical protein